MIACHFDFDRFEFADRGILDIDFLSGKGKDDDEASLSLYKAFESSLGGLVWVVCKTQSHMSYCASNLASRKKNLKIGDCKMLNKVIKMIKSEPLRPKIPSLKFSDAADLRVVNPQHSCRGRNASRKNMVLLRFVIHHTMSTTNLINNIS